jgi:hypothetical protein
MAHPSPDRLFRASFQTPLGSRNILAQNGGRENPSRGVCRGPREICTWFSGRLIMSAPLAGGCLRRLPRTRMASMTTAPRSRTTSPARPDHRAAPASVPCRGRDKHRAQRTIGHHQSGHQREGFRSGAGVRSQSTSDEGKARRMCGGGVIEGQGVVQ